MSPEGQLYSQYAWHQNENRLYWLSIHVNVAIINECGGGKKGEKRASVFSVSSVLPPPAICARLAHRSICSVATERLARIKPCRESSQSLDCCLCCHSWSRTVLKAWIDEFVTVSFVMERKRNMTTFICVIANAISLEGKKEKKGPSWNLWAWQMVVHVTDSWKCGSWKHISWEFATMHLNHQRQPEKIC